MEIASTSYRVHLEQFDGPLDLLLHLVREAKLDITEISLALVAEQYFAYLETMQQLDVELESSYLVVFAQLLELKSRLLLPYEESEDESDGDEFVGDDEWGNEPSLVQKLNDYALVKEAAGWLSKREDEALACYARPLPLSLDITPDLDVSLDALVRAMRRLERSSRAPRAAVSVAKIVLSVPERIEQLSALFNSRSRALFSYLVGDAPSRDMIIVTFLALLEMVRQRKVTLTQEHTVEDILVIKVSEHD